MYKLKFGFLFLILELSVVFSAAATNVEWISLAAEFQTLYSQGDINQATKVAEQLVPATEKILGPDHPNVATALSYLAMGYSAQDQANKAEPLLIRALSIYDRVYGTTNNSSATTISKLGMFYKDKFQFEKAEEFFKKAILISEKMNGQNNLNYSLALNNLANLYEIQGQVDIPESLYKKALEISESTLGLDSPFVSVTLNNMGGFYDGIGKQDLAESFYKRALNIKEKSYGPDHLNLVATANNLGLLYFRQKKYAQAEALFKKSILIIEKNIGQDSSLLTTIVNNLGEVYRDQGQYEIAEELFLKGLKINENYGGLMHPDVGLSLTNLARLYQAQRQYEKSNKLYARAISIFESNFGSDHLIVAKVLSFQESLYLIQNQLDRALPIARRISEIYQHHFSLAETDESASNILKKARESFITHLDILQISPFRANSVDLVEETFKLSQLTQLSESSSAVEKMATRFSKGNDAIALLIKRKQDAANRRSKYESRLVKSAGQPSEKRNLTAERQLRDEIVNLRNEIVEIETEIGKQFPEFQELIRPMPLKVKQVQELMQPNEAMISYVIAEKQSWLWVIRSNKAVFIPIKTDKKFLDEQVKKIRSQMETDELGKLSTVDVNILHDLYTRLFEPAVPHLVSAEHVMLVPTGALQSLPFSMLVASHSKANVLDSDYSGVDWLIKDYSFSVLPSISSIRALRHIAKPIMGKQPFIGFGAPVLTDEPVKKRSTRSIVSTTGLFRNTELNNVAGLQVDVADVNLIRGMSSLPESENEITEMAKILKASENTMWLRANATETNVKKIDLSKYQIIAFATHGIMAGEIGKKMEAGLILTPPSRGTPEDDGYLSTGEIAQLKLNADLVLLSACNTAAPDGSIGAESLSGFAKAFFYAGTRSLLVSHWPVISEATVPLTTMMIREYQLNPGQGKAEAHRKSILSLMYTSDHPEYSHPLFWAPFFVVGEGGGNGMKRVKVVAQSQLSENR